MSSKTAPTVPKHYQQQATGKPGQASKPARQQPNNNKPGKPTVDLRKGTGARGYAARTPQERRANGRTGGKTTQARGHLYQMTLEQRQAAGRKGGLATAANRAKRQQQGGTP